MPTLVIPNSFNANTVARSSEVNANFSAIATLLNSTKLNSDNIQAGGIATSNLADASVTKAKLDSDALYSSSSEIQNLAIASSVGSSALTVALKGKDGNDPSSTNILTIGFRSSTSASGVYTRRSITSAVSTIVSNGSTLGHRDGIQNYIYVYALDNGGTVELAVSTKLFDEGSVVSTTAEGGAGGADSATVMYSSTARSNVPCRLLGRLTVTEATAGAWITAASEISLVPFTTPEVINSQVYVYGGNGRGSTNTCVRRFSSTHTSTGNAITYADSSTDGALFTINEPGFYSITYADGKIGGVTDFSVTLNGTELTTNPDAQTRSQQLLYFRSSSGGNAASQTQIWKLASGSLIRPQCDTDADLADDSVLFNIVQISKA